MSTNKNNEARIVVIDEKTRPDDDVSTRRVLLLSENGVSFLYQFKWPDNGQVEWDYDPDGGASLSAQELEKVLPILTEWLKAKACSGALPKSESEIEETDIIIITGRRVPFVQVGMIVHPDDCLNCERDGSPLWCSALVCDHDHDGMTATLLFRNGERREEPFDELRRRWRMACDFNQGRVYTGRWGAVPRGSVWPVAEVGLGPVKPNRR